MTRTLSRPHRPVATAPRAIAARDDRAPGWLARWLAFAWRAPPAPSTFHKCLAVHLHNAGPKSALRD